MQMDAGLDTGPVLRRAACAIGDDDTGASLDARLADLGAATMVETLADLATPAAAPMHAEAQDETLATYAGRIAKADGLLDWSRPAEVLERQVRAFNPWPVAFAILPPGRSPAMAPGDDCASGMRGSWHTPAGRLRERCWQAARRESTWPQGAARCAF